MGSVALGIPGVRPPGGVPSPDPSRPDDPRLVDRFGRVATDLRISLTDRCNLRCSYCMPPEGLDWMPSEQGLTDSEVIRLVTIAVTRLGVDEVRFTGGEPLLRKGLEKIVHATSELWTPAGQPVETSLTTNGLGLTRRAAGLAAAGLNRVNVSLDTLRRDVFEQITHRDRLDDVLAGARAAADAGMVPVKINSVLLSGVNDAEAPELLGWALEHGYQLRFIEQMPLDAQGSWHRDSMVTAEQILALLQARFDLEPTDPATRGAAPAETWWVRRPGSTEVLGKVGIIGSVTRPFCGDCDRTRLTADGQVRSCLFGNAETDLRGLMRDGVDDDTLADVWRTAMWGKKAGHGVDDEGFLKPARPMSAIGG
ncbi:MAG TPA: GTP 3',8-cyclase MoaA [Actinomycetales bacterium]|nr:GTP 3',8-cyclase MoaA [Actinomycetales bacterium]